YERFILIGSFGRPEGSGSSDIYVSFHKEGDWTLPRPLGPEVNTPFREYSPRLSADGKMLIFASEKGFGGERRGKSWTAADLDRQTKSILNGLGNIYEIPLKSVLEPLQ